MRSTILSSIGGFLLLLAALCILAPGKINASPLALPQLDNGLTQRSALAAADGDTLDFTRALRKRKSKGGKKGGKVSKGAIAAIIIIVIIVLILVLAFFWWKKRKASGH